MSAQVGQHSPGGVTGLAQFVTGHKIAWQSTLPLNLERQIKSQDKREIKVIILKSIL